MGVELVIDLLVRGFGLAGDAGLEAGHLALRSGEVGVGFGEHGGGDSGTEGAGLGAAGDQHGAAGDVGVELHEKRIFAAMPRRRRRGRWARRILWSVG